MDRKWFVNYHINSKIKDVIRNAKKGNEFVAHDDLEQFDGMITYMKSVGDITEEIYKKLYNIEVLIRRKYHLY